MLMMLKIRTQSINMTMNAECAECRGRKPKYKKQTFTTNNKSIDTIFNTRLLISRFSVTKKLNWKKKHKEKNYIVIVFNMK